MLITVTCGVKRLVHPGKIVNLAVLFCGKQWLRLLKAAGQGYFFTDLCDADRLAQLVEYRTTVQEVVGSNPGWTNT